MKIEELKITIINESIEHIILLFKNITGYSGIYQVGSSISTPHKSNDLDILIIGSQDQKSKFNSKIDFLRKKIFENKALSGSFDATNENIKITINSIATMLSKKYGLKILPEYVIGPTKIKINCFCIQICGPMPLCDYQHLFKMLPFHALAFFAQNKPLLGPRLSEILTSPSPSLQEYKEWQYAIFKRLKIVTSDSEKIKIIKKILLTKYLFDGILQPYEKVEKKITELNNKIRNMSNDQIFNHIFNFAMNK